ncbi:MAG TPA: hypothetical protein VNI77_02225 [Nitrososphaera sp.]|nr:hypothetical protein [Nitrososphaera sp.]
MSTATTTITTTTCVVEGNKEATLGQYGLTQVPQENGIKRCG